MRRESSSSSVRRYYLPFLLIMTAFSQISAQTTTTTAPTTTTGTSTTNSQTTTSEITTVTSTTPLPLLTTEESGTTLATADSAAPTTAVVTESSNLEATTEGQSSNEALRTSGLRRGYRFESTRNKPAANQETTPKPEPAAVAKERPEEKKIAWKFGRGGNNQEGWSVRPTPNSGYPLWKKQVVSSNGAQPQSDEGNGAASKNPGDQQAYIVWNVGQGNGPNGWTLNGASDGWSPGGVSPVNGGWSPTDAAAVGNTGNGWNTEGWVEDQPPSEEDSQEGGWVDEGAQPINAGGEWAPQGGAPQQAGWVEANGNVANGWTNGSPQVPVVNSPPPNGWAAQPNAPQANGWSAGPPQVNPNGGGWIAPQQGANGWAPPTTAGPIQQNGQTPEAVSGWNPGTVQVENAGWDQNTGGWTNPAANGGGWNNGAPAAEGGGWSNGQQSGGWNNGIQDAGLSWKVYNEDTQTMENLDDNSGWKVVGDGGTDGWKLVDENGNVEWKIENINGEWKVTSADELPTVDNSTATAADATNATTESTNSTSEEVTATTPAPGGGWDDDKQGRYIVWKFSEDGKGEARVYGGGGAEPEVWRVGDNNQYWKETMGIKSNDNNAQVANGGWNPDGTAWQSDVGWQNAYNTGSSGRWKNSEANKPQQNNGWQNGGVSPQVTGAAWQNGGSAVGWQTGANAAPKPNGGRGWKAGNAGQQNGGNGWKQKVVRPSAPQTTTWSNNGATPQQANGWQNQQPQTNGAWNGRNGSPQTATGWQNTGTGNQPINAGPQGAWQNGATAPQTNGGWTATGANGKKPRTKGRWRNPANGNRNANGWQQNKPSNGNKNGVRGPWNNGNGNRNSAWTQRNTGAGQASWSNAPTPSVAPTVNGNSQNTAVWQNGANQAGLPAGWSPNGKNGQTVPYIIVVKTPEATANGQNALNSWSNGGQSNTGNAKRVKSRNKPRNNRRSSGWKMNRAGSSGWQWNPQGGREGWKWMDGWMGSGGGFGGWMGDKDTMYSGWRPTKTNGQSPIETQSPNPEIAGAAKNNKKAGSKMVFVFGTKKNSSGGWAKPNGKKNKKVIILDYTTAGKKAPKGDDGMKKDIESVIQALKSGRPANVQGRTVWKQAPQVTNQQQWGG